MLNLNKKSYHRSVVLCDCVQGFFIIEALFVVLLFSVSILSTSRVLDSVSYSRGVIQRRIAAESVARDRLERLLTLDPSSLDDSHDSQFDTSFGGFMFRCIIDVSAASDETKSISVLVETRGSKYPVSISLRHDITTRGED